jgi:hypothetical protein
LLAARQWVLNEKAAVERAGLRDVERALMDPGDLGDLVERVGDQLQVPS